MEQRKSDHLQICLQQDVGFKGLTAGFEHCRLVHQALPELAPDDVDLSTVFLGKRLRAPLLVSPMTGGTPAAAEINRTLAAAAAALGIAMGVGSQRAAIEDPALTPTYSVRDTAPAIALLANLGAVQLNYGYGMEQCRRAVEMIDADALVLHLNPLQECLQPEGNRDFRALLPKIAEVCRSLGRPVIVKEVGWGLSSQVVRALFEAGVYAVDVAGAGGTSWGEVERRRALSDDTAALAATFAAWGIPTAEAIRDARAAAGEGRVIIGSGGICDGLQGAKALALGADLVGMALPLLRPATLSVEAVVARLELFLAELRLAAFLTGSRSVAALGHCPMVLSGPLAG
ncbi:MAG TPA: type 2 isopentenyl-diphosphate Delta-isomerase [Anaerolineae bacterium]|nr:type 2 isopentenyl-diphosphate Delta-isomerase [Anaerolineae bacterium]HOQ98814.1 type 2 isopentenyl-diphosphate Delta-isomerase [Anaerolineae bacterium]HPL28046.1 type 2 isopentenyl-diphosphate Delta-isomerase [Anaerolineae bacterium]